MRALARTAIALAVVLPVAGTGAAVAEPGASAETAPAQLSRDRPTGIALKAGFTSKAPGRTDTPELGRIALEFNPAVEFHTGLPSCPLAEVGAPAGPARAAPARSSAAARWTPKSRSERTLAPCRQND
jgi:hypothetical protein